MNQQLNVFTRANAALVNLRLIGGDNSTIGRRDRNMERGKYMCRGEIGARKGGSELPWTLVVLCAGGNQREGSASTSIALTSG